MLTYVTSKNTSRVESELTEGHARAFSSENKNEHGNELSQGGPEGIGVAGLGG